MQELHTGVVQLSIEAAFRAPIFRSTETKTREESKMAYYNETASWTHSISSRAAAFFDAISLRYRQNRAYNTTLNELAVLNSRELSDLGLHRSELRNVASEAAAKVK